MGSSASPLHPLLRGEIEVAAGGLWIGVEQANVGC